MKKALSLRIARVSRESSHLITNETGEVLGGFNPGQMNSREVRRMAERLLKSQDKKLAKKGGK